MLYCERWDKPLENVSEWQQADCEKNGWNCIDCLHCGEIEDKENEEDADVL